MSYFLPFSITQLNTEGKVRLTICLAWRSSLFLFSAASNFSACQSSHRNKTHLKGFFQNTPMDICTL